MKDAVIEKLKCSQNIAIYTKDWNQANCDIVAQLALHYRRILQHAKFY